MLFSIAKMPGSRCGEGVGRPPLPVVEFLTQTLGEFLVRIVAPTSVTGWRLRPIFSLASGSMEDDAALETVTTHLAAATRR